MYVKIIIFVFLLTACAQFEVDYKYPNGTHVHGTYFRFGNQEFQDFKIRGDSGLEIELGYQKANAEILEEILKLSREIARKIP